MSHGANAPSLEHEFMSLEKKLIWPIFENNDARDDFFEDKWVRHVRMPQFDQKKNLFKC